MTDPELVDQRKTALYANAPFHPHGDLAAWKSTVIVAPHPDDEALGCGGLIALLAARGQRVSLLFVSDGSMSHPNSKVYPRKRRIELREQEARQAGSVLGVLPQCIHFLRLPDTKVPRRWDGDFAPTAKTIADVLTTCRADTLIVPWRRDPHGDHRASWELCREARRHYETSLRWIEYPVWMWEAKNVVDLPRPDEMIAWRLEVADQLPIKERAIRAHRSQWDGVITDDPEGFQLEDRMIAHFLRPAELYFEEAEKRQRSLTESYFNGVYRDDQDPWNFEHSTYEKSKYAATLAALPQERYPNALEIGCSIGVLTELLVTRCDRLLAIDTSIKPLERARERLAAVPQVTFQQMEVPRQFPQEQFDLIVLSEVGYYWGYDNLDRAIERIESGLLPGGTLILVHYTPYVPDYPLTGDEVHEAFMRKLNACYHCTAERTERYRLDVWKKKGSSGPNA